MFKPLGYRVTQFNSFATLMVGYFANLAAPRFGEIVRAGMINRYENVAIEKAIATIFVERVVDLMMLMIMLAIGFIFRYEQLWGYISNNSSLNTGIILIVLFSLLLLAFVGVFVIRRAISINDNKLSGWKLKAKKLVQGFVDALKEIQKMPRKTLFWIYSIGIWLMYYLMHYLAFFSFEPVSHLKPLDGVLVFDFGTLGILFPSQGGLGSYHVMVIEALKVFDVNPIDGMSFAMITFFTLTIFCTIFIGMISLLLLPMVNNKRKSSD